jgi:hypothetical protein
MSSYACESGIWNTVDCTSSSGSEFSVPISFNIYEVGPNDTVGSLLATTTQTFQFPYRPSADNVHCTDSQTGWWYDSDTSTCYAGIARNITFDFSQQGVLLPDSVIYGIAFNTTGYGTAPIGTGAACYASSGGCTYDALTVDLSPQVVVGSKPLPDTAFVNSLNASYYCDGGTGGTGSLRIDSLPTNDCWGDEQIPAVQFTASAVPGSGPFAWIFNFQALLKKYRH